MGINYCTIGFCSILLSLMVHCLTLNAELVNKNDQIFIRGKFFNRNGSSNNMVSTMGYHPPLTFAQCMDHQNDPSCSQTWDQRYWVNSDYYQSGGPIFLMLGAEGDANGLIGAGAFDKFGKQYNAMLICIEHRFYGESIPTKDSSMESMQLLTSQQALADAAHLLRWFKQQNNLMEAKTVVFGGSYGGNLAAWFREMYPNDVNIAVSSSGPVMAKFDMSEYLQKCAEVIKELDQDCYTTISSAFRCMEDIVHMSGSSYCSSSVNDRSQLPDALGMSPTDFSNQGDREHFFRSLSSSWMSNNPGTNNLPACKLLQEKQKSDDIISIYGAFLKEFNSRWGRQQTYGETKEALEFIKSDAGIKSGAAGWDWQTCNEFGYFITPDPEHVFGYDFSTYKDVYGCKYNYGDVFTSDYIQSRVEQTNAYYKGKENSGTCIIFVNGQWDPWSMLGVTRSDQTSEQNSVVYIKGAEHCDDMAEAKNAEMEDAHRQIQQLIGEYLNNPGC